MYNYKAKVVRVVDGDTVDLKVDLGFHISANERFRIKDIDTPEIWRPSCESELEHDLGIGSGCHFAGCLVCSRNCQGIG